MSVHIHPNPPSTHTPPALADCDALVVGAGFAGATIARELAERGGLRVAVIERRAHIAGNAYDCFDEQGVQIHAYGPHIYHTASPRVHAWLSRFTDWRAYDHKVLANVRGSFLPVPFNLNSLDAAFNGEKAAHLSELLLTHYGEGARVPIIELRADADPLLRELADYVYENIFLRYTMKQWGQTPEEIDPSITARVPVLVARDDRYFQDPYQGMPLEGYTRLFERMLEHPNIEVHLGLDARAVLEWENLPDEDTSGAEGAAPPATPDPVAPEAAPFSRILVNGQPYGGLVIYSGALDELCRQRYGLLPYRTLDLVYRHHDHNPVQPCGTVNYTVSEPYTRTTEFTWLTGQDSTVSTVMEEYSLAYTGADGQTPYYPVVGALNQRRWERYLALFSHLDTFYPLGRLAEYRYYNMDQIVLRALELADELI